MGGFSPKQSFYVGSFQGAGQVVWGSLYHIRAFVIGQRILLQLVQSQEEKHHGKTLLSTTRGAARYRVSADSEVADERLAGLLGR